MFQLLTLLCKFEFYIEGVSCKIFSMKKGDATATVNDELHLSTLKNLAFGFAHILSTDELCRYLEN